VNRPRPDGRGVVDVIVHRRRAVIFAIGYFVM
jgi:hypothetical protein